MVLETFSHKMILKKENTDITDMTTKRAIAVLLYNSLILQLYATISKTETELTEY